MLKRLCNIFRIKPPYLNFQWLIGLSSIYVAKQQRTKWNHQNKYFSYLSIIVFNIISKKQFLRLGQNLPLSYPLLLIDITQIVFTTYSSFRTVCNSKCYVPNWETSKLLRMLKCQCYLYRPMYVNLSQWK